MLLFDERYATFEMFSVAHLIPVLIIVALIVLIIFFRKPLRQNVRLDRRLRIGFAVAMVAMEWIFYAWVIIPDGTDWNLLPLGLCALSMYLTAVTLLTENRKIFRTVFPWALAGSLLSLIVADVNYVFPHFRYFHYFGNHGMFLIANIYLVVVKRYSFTYRDLLGSSLVLTVLSTGLFFLNRLLDTNHMYLVSLPSEVSFLFLWLGYPGWVFGFGLAIFALFHLVTFPFILLTRARKRKAVADPV